MKLYFILILSTLIITGCAHKKNSLSNKPKTLETKIEIKENVIETKKEISSSDKEKEEIKKEEIKNKKDEKKETIKENKKEKVKETIYRALGTVEVFTYKGRYRTQEFDETKLVEPFYLKKGLVRIEKIYTSKNGDRYGKFTGKNLFISMDDLVNK